MKKTSNIILSITSFGILLLITSFVDIYTPITCNIIMKSSIDSGRDFAQVFFDTGNSYNEKESVNISKKHEEDFSFLAILVLPDISCSTAKVYANYKHNDNRYKQLRDRVGAELSKNRIEKISKMCANMLQISSFGLYPELAKLKAQIESLDIRPLCMSGSGCSMYHILESCNVGQAEEYLRKIKKHIECKCVLIMSNRW